LVERYQGITQSVEVIAAGKAHGTPQLRMKRTLKHES
jgi:hypothetical protein